MSSEQPIVKRSSWPAIVIPHVIAAALCMGAGWLIGQSFMGVFIGAIVYVIFAFGARTMILVHHREGLAQAQKGKFHKAIEAHQESYRFFKRYGWIDRCRMLLLIASPISYTEQALLNIAHCYTLYGDSHKAKAYYKRCLHDFPKSDVAKSALAAIRAAKAAGIDEPEDEIEGEVDVEIEVRMRST